MATQPKKSRPSAARSAGRPSYVKPKVIPPGRRKNADYRTREHLTQDEVDALMEAAGKTGRHPHRDRTLILLAFRHALRVSELVSLRWSQVDFRNGILHVTRLKNGIPSTHPLHGPELRALRKLSRDYPEAPYVFVSERGGPLTVDSVQKIVRRAGEKAGLPFPVHPHQLRHACGYHLANQGIDTRAIQLYLGHKSITHTARYTELASSRFDDFWGD